MAGCEGKHSQKVANYFTSMFIVDQVLPLELCHKTSLILQLTNLDSFASCSLSSAYMYKPGLL